MVTLQDDRVSVRPKAGSGAGGRSLICEGRCNPDLGRLDDIITNFRRNELSHKGRQTGGTRYPVDMDLAAALRRLKHTEHAPTNQYGRWKCTDCGTVRNYGKTPYTDAARYTPERTDFA